jgi:tRNA wybutosine-synthesizing protein 2
MSSPPFITSDMRIATPPNARPRRKPKPKPPNPISNGILLWLDTVPQSLVDTTGCARDELGKKLVDGAPKRWVVYHPMVLLPAGSFANEVWEKRMLSQLDERRRGSLWEGILREIARSNGIAGAGAGAAGQQRELTHLAVSEGIPAQTGTGRGKKGAGGRDGGFREGNGAGAGDGPRAESDAVGEEEENVIRAPTNLRILHGDFGPEPTRESRLNPTQDDFDRAFWVVTKQNGIVQTWAPRYTMFSRGNVKEKARLLEFHERPDRKLRGDAFAVDLYAGIGYFAFSYAKLGMRVLCWEINPWSVEALRRGAGMNGWSVRIAPEEYLDDGETSASEFIRGCKDDTIVVFPEDNAKAEGRMCDLENCHIAIDIVHVNCGLLPSSTPTWRDALRMVSKPEGWLHLHENVGAADIEPRRKEIQGIFDGWNAEETEMIRRHDPRHQPSGRKVVVEHVEQVKTFAPGVWHCVFDVHVTWSDTASNRS